MDFVSVLPTHRRRGILTSMMDELWRRCAADGRPLACLWPSESAIYGRYGFGAATEVCRIEIDSTRPLALRTAPDNRPLRMIDPAGAPAVLAPRYDATLARRAGRFTRDEGWWRCGALDLDGASRRAGEDGFGAAQVVVLGAPGRTPGGYAVYRTRGPGGNGPGAVRVGELEAESGPAAAALWSYLVSIDLTSTVEIEGRPADDPLLHLAADRDQVRVTGQEPALWLRLLDVRAALTARSWTAPADLVVDLRDTALPANAGRFRLTAGPGGATWEPTREEPDISLDVRELGSCYLGEPRCGTSFTPAWPPSTLRVRSAAWTPPWRPSGCRSPGRITERRARSDQGRPAPAPVAQSEPPARRVRSAAITNTSCHAPSQNSASRIRPSTSKPHFSYARRARGL